MFNRLQNKEDIKIDEGTLGTLVEPGTVDLATSDEIAEEQSQRLQLLTDEKDIGEEKSRDEKVRRQDKERQEHDRSTAKRQGEILAAKEKANEYLKTKREDLRMTQMLELMEQNDEEEARLGRLVANRER